MEVVLYLDHQLLHCCSGNTQGQQMLVPEVTRVKIYAYTEVPVVQDARSVTSNNLKVSFVPSSLPVACDARV